MWPTALKAGFWRRNSRSARPITCSGVTASILAVSVAMAGTWPKASVAEPLREELLQLCRQRLDAFREQRGEEVGCLLTQKPAASGTGAATAPRSAARSKSGHGADGLALHQPEWNAVVELVHSIQR